MISITPTFCRTNNVSFKSKENDEYFAYDDDVSKNRRDYIRKTYESRHMPYYDIIENNGRLSEYNLNALINRLCGVKPNKQHKIKEGTILEQFNEMTEQVQSDNINDELMKTLPLYNVKPIFTTGCYRGSTPNSNLDSIKILKKAGVKHIVDLQGYSRVKDACKENDMDYFHIPIKEDLSEMSAFKSKRDIELEVMQWSSYSTKEQIQESKNRAVRHWEKDKNEYMDKFVKMINLLQEDNTYIGCEYGISRTNNAMLLNHLFNPKASKTPNCRTKFNNQYMNNIASFYENLTPEHKAQMGWTKEFDENFMPKLKKLQSSKIEYNY